ncbi:MAG TPA: UDP-3-O-[3-hydroxymyristoyl] N-acetylglucosamine deacetylase [Rikenellaceae bacterium]|nr:UDP-3-O-[3-hydroxymyristoyl] N-acetylglucosamine deacetylase [Rikenellaceae bacterium]
MNLNKQKTLAAEYAFHGKGLHTGKVSNMVLRPAPVNTGIVFHRTDLGEMAVVEALAENVSSTARSTTISKGEASVATIEHLMSALTGMGVDNAIVEIDNVEVPILDGSARYYVEAISKDGLKEQDAERQYITIPEEIEVRDEKTGSFVRITPADAPSMDVTVDFGSRVLGVQTAHWDESTDYSTQIGPCRTFVFFHEIEYLFQNNLVKGGDVDNAIVIVEHPVQPEQIERLSALFNVPKLSINDNGYLNNLQLHFPNECGRHKLLDLIGDLRLAGGYLKAKVTAFKPGHTINTRTAAAIRERIRK